MSIVFADGHQCSGRLCAVSSTGGCAEVDTILAPSTLVHLTFRTASGPISAVAEMLAPLKGNRQPFRFIGLDEEDRSRLQQFMEASQPE